MAEEGKKSILEQAQEMLGGNAEGGLGSILEQAKGMLGGNAEGGLGNVLEQAKGMLGDAVGDTEELKRKATELGKKLTPDSLDDKVEAAVDKAVDFLREKLGNK